MTDDTTHETVHACRDCGEEYRPGILVCADCGGEIVVRGRHEAPPAPVPEEPGPPNELTHALFVSGRAMDVVPVCERLREGDIEHRLAEQPSTSESVPPRYAVFVRPSDEPRALAAIADLLAPHETGADVGAVAAHFDEEHGYLRCPACGASTRARELECHECGLVLRGEEAAQEPPE